MFKSLSNYFPVKKIDERLKSKLFIDLDRKIQEKRRILGMGIDYPKDSVMLSVYSLLLEELMKDEQASSLIEFVNAIYLNSEDKVYTMLKNNELSPFG